MKVLSLFSGIGAFEKALDKLGVQYNLVNYCEIDKYASKSYAAVHNVSEEINLGDITKIDISKLDKNIDLITYGFPCQDISLAGKQQGLFNNDGTKTRSGLFFEALRIIENIKPKVAIAENVKNLTSKKFKEQFEIVLQSLDAAGYNNYWQVLNAKDYGVPQNRERVFIVSIRKDMDTGCFKFPEPFELKLRLKDLLESEVDEKYYVNSKINWCDNVNKETTTGLVQVGNLDIKGQDIVKRVYSSSGLSPTLTDMQGGNRQPKVLLNTEPQLVGGVGEKNFGKQYRQGNRVYDSNAVAMCLLSQPVGNAGGNSYLYAVTDNKVGVVTSAAMRGRYNKLGEVEQNIEVSNREYANAITTVQKDSLISINRIDVPQTVIVRKYPVDTNLLCECLRDHKEKTGFTNREIAETLDLPITQVEHWFRRDNCFSIPEANIWFKLKELLSITTDEFDKSIMTFEEREGVYEKSERHYFTDGLSPTLTSTSAGNEKFINSNLRIRKLTPLECWRLMGFDDKDFYEATKVNSNTQLYKQAGNSIVVDVLVCLFKSIFDTGIFNNNFFN